MKHRYRKTRIREVAAELVAMIQERYPDVEHLSTSRWPAGTVVIRIYAPYDNFLEVLEVTSARQIEIQLAEGIPALVLPTRQKPARRIA